MATERRRRGFAASFEKLVRKGVRPHDLAEFVLRARLLRASSTFARELPPDPQERLLPDDLAGKAAANPELFEKVLIERERQVKARKGDLVDGLPAKTLCRIARGDRRLTPEEGRRLDESPMGAALLRYAEKQGSPIRSLTEVEPAILPKIAKGAGQREIERGAEQYLVQLVHDFTGHWYFRDVAILLGAKPDDADVPAKQLKDRSEDYRIRRKDAILPD